jgi:hypothetical protein
MDESSDEDVIPKTDQKPFSIQLKPSLDSNSSNDDDDIHFSTNCLLKVKTDYKSSVHSPNKKKLFDSEDSDFKKNLFCSDNAQKSDMKKSSDYLSTEPTSFVVKNLNSPKKKYSVIKMVEKKKKMNKNYFTNKIVETTQNQDTTNKKERLDFYGNVIKKKNKKRIKVSFIDYVTSQPLVDIINIESFKNYNFIEGMPGEEGVAKSAECVCCSIF